MSEENANLDGLLEIDTEKPDASSEDRAQTGQFHSAEGEVTYSPSQTNNYKTLRSISGVFKVLAWISGGISVISGIAALGSIGSGYNGPGPGFYVALFAVFQGLSMAVLFAFLSESVNVILDIEANSRQTAKTLERILRIQ